MSQLSRKYDQRHTRTFFNNAGIPYETAMLIRKGPQHYFIISYEQDFKIAIKKPQGWINEVTIHKYA